MSEYVVRHGSVLQDIEYQGVMPPDIVDRITIKHGVPMPDATEYGNYGGGSVNTVYVGSTTPTADIGADGDIYIVR